MKMPVVAIVGRPNVGKSSLLNALTRRKISIVEDMPGVTRDRISQPYQVAGKWIDLVDTGGFGFDDAQGLTDHIKHQIELAVGRANLVLFVVDAHDGLVEGDKIIAKLLREKSIKTVLIANKSDGPKYEQALADFARLGLGTPLGVSATTSHNLAGIAEAIASNLDLSHAPAELPEPDLSIAVVGKRNAGKSTLVNAISSLYEDDPERVIVSEVPGTTRDSVDVRFEKDGRTLIVIDTAGVRKKRHMVNNDIEFYSFHRAERSIRRADVVLMLVDAVEPISDPDKKLADYIAQQFKPVVIVFNKWDLALEQARASLPPGETLDDTAFRQKFVEYTQESLKGLRFAPIAFISAKELKKVGAVLDLARALFRQTQTRVTTAKLNEAVEICLKEQAPTGGGRKRPRVYYATQVEIAPPTIALFVNHEEFFPAPYQRFVINRFRELLPFAQVPIKLLVRAREDEARKAPPKKRSPNADKRPATRSKRPATRPKRP